jgi:hypothetical protein
MTIAILITLRLCIEPVFRPIVFVGPLVVEEFKRIIRDSEVTKSVPPPLVASACASCSLLERGI